MFFGLENKMKNLLTKTSAALSFCAAAVACPALFAQESGVTPAEISPETLIKTTDLQQTIANSLTSWLGIGLSVGVSLLAVYAGWKWLRRFIK